MEINNEDPTNAYNTKKSTNNLKLEHNSTNFHAFSSGKYHTDNLPQLQNMLLLAQTGTLNLGSDEWEHLEWKEIRWCPSGKWEKSGTGCFCWGIEDEIWMELGRGMEMHGRSEGLCGVSWKACYFCTEKGKIIISFVQQINFIYFWCIMAILECCTVISDY